MTITFIRQGIITLSLVAMPLVPVTKALAEPVPQVQATNHQVLSNRRVGRTIFEYGFQITFENQGAEDISDLTFTPSSSASSTQIVSNSLAIEQLDGGTSAIATGTVIVRQNRRVPFQLSAIDFNADGDIAPPPPPPSGEPGLLPGDPSASAVESIVLEDGPLSDESALGDGFLFDRLRVLIDPGATVGEVNAALMRHDARINASRPNQFSVTVRIPRQASETALDALVSAMNSESSFFLVKRSEILEPQELPSFAVPDDLLTYVDELGPYLISKFPAVWNLRDRMIKDGATGDASIFVVDFFPTDSHPEVQPFVISNPGRGATIHHGLSVLSSITGNYDSTGLTGVVPTDTSQPAIAFNMQFVPGNDLHYQMAKAIPSAGTVIANHSYSYFNTVPPEADQLLDRALDALYAKVELGESVDRIAHIHAAGNDGRAIEIASALAIAAQFDNPCSITTEAPSSTPMPADDLAFCEEQRVALTSELGSFFNASLPNVVFVGSASTETSLSSFSNTIFDVAANGENLILACADLPTDAFCNPSGASGSVDVTGFIKGTSFSSPQIAGLTYIMNRLRPDAPLEIVLALVKGSGEQNPGSFLTDAYLAVLELDRIPPGGGPAMNGLDHLTVANSTRGAILDVRSNSGDPDTPELDEKFTEVDLEAFIDAFIGDPVNELDNSPGQLNYSRFDLNGDGRTGGNDFARFDLNNDGEFTTAFVDIGGERFTYNEQEVTDGNVLCYYTFAGDLYTGSPGFRNVIFAIFGNMCLPVGFSGDLETRLEITRLTTPPGWVFTTPGAPVVVKDIIPNLAPITRYRGNFRAPFSSNCGFGERGRPPHSLQTTLDGGNFYVPDIDNAPYVNNFGPVREGCSNFVSFENGAAYINITRRLDRRSGSFTFENESQMRMSIPRASTDNERTSFIEFYFLGTISDGGSTDGSFDINFQMDLIFATS